jgi:hypothetical protein
VCIEEAKLGVLGVENRGSGGAIGHGRGKAQELISKGVIPPIKIGRAQLVRVVDLETWLAGQTATPGEVTR